MGDKGVGVPWWLGVRAVARGVVIPSIRAVAADVAARADFDLDAIDDVRMAVDDLCAMLVRIAAPEAMLWCEFTVGDERMEVVAEVEVLGGMERLPVGSFSWRVLECLTEQLCAVALPAQPPQRARVRVRWEKHAVRAPQP